MSDPNTIHRMFCRHDPANSSNNQGFGPVSYSCSAAEATSLWLAAEAVIRPTRSSALGRDSLALTYIYDEAVLVRRTASHDGMTRQNLSSQVIFGPPGLVTPALALGLERAGALDEDPPPGTEEPSSLPPLNVGELRRLAQPGSVGLLADCKEHQGLLTHLTGWLLEHPRSNISLLEKDFQGQSTTVLMALIELMGPFLEGFCSFSTLESEESSQYRFMILPSWPPPGEADHDRLRIDMSRHPSPESAADAELLVDAYLTVGADGLKSRYQKGRHGADDPPQRRLALLLEDLRRHPVAPPIPVQEVVGQEVVVQEVKAAEVLGGTEPIPGADPFAGGIYDIPPQQGPAWPKMPPTQPSQPQTGTRWSAPVQPVAPNRQQTGRHSAKCVPVNPSGEGSAPKEDGRLSRLYRAGRLTTALAWIRRDTTPKGTQAGGAVTVSDAMLLKWAATSTDAFFTKHQVHEQLQARRLEWSPAEAVAKCSVILSHGLGRRQSETRRRQLYLLLVEPVLDYHEAAAAWARFLVDHRRSLPETLGPALETMLESFETHVASRGKSATPSSAEYAVLEALGPEAIRRILRMPNVGTGEYGPGSGPSTSTPAGLLQLVQGFLTIFGGCTLTALVIYLLVLIF